MTTYSYSCVVGEQTLGGTAGSLCEATDMAKGALRRILLERCRDGPPPNHVSWFESCEYAEGGGAIRTMTAIGDGDVKIAEAVIRKETPRT